MELKQKILSGACLLLSLVTTGCAAGDTGDNQEESEGSEESEQEADTSENGPFPVEITDASDETVTLEKEPERIVSLIPSNTEIAFALGLEEEIVGVSDHADYPEEASETEKVGGIDFNVEKIISLEPDLVLAHASSLQQSQEGLQQLEEAGIKVLVVNEAASFEGTYDSIEMIGRAVGASTEAEEVIAGMKEEVQDIEKQASEITEEEQKTVWMEIQPPPDIYTTGSNTFQNEILNMIHAENAAGGEEGWIPYTAEAAVKLNPDVIITTYGSFSEGDPEEQIKNRDGWSSVPAVENGEIHDVNSDTLSRPGPRLTEGAEELAELVYPDVFAE
ncbi:ABC transporter substrate-binding protein [Salibacterium sp. K-3]